MAESKLKLALESLKTVSKNIMEGNEVKVSEEVYNKRMIHCHNCEYYKKTLNMCGNCGCNLAIKGRLAGMKCPCGKWEE